MFYCSTLGLRSAAAPVVGQCTAESLNHTSQLHCMQAAAHRRGGSRGEGLERRDSGASNDSTATDNSDRRHRGHDERRRGEHRKPRHVRAGSHASDSDRCAFQ